MPLADAGESRPSGRGGVSRADRLLDRLDAVESRLWLVVVGALVLDVVLTYQGLRLGFVEANPVLGPAMESFGFVALGVAKAGALGIGAAYRVLRPEYGAVIPLGLALPWLAAAAVNTVHIAPVVMT